MKIPFTWKTAWFISESRRHRLIERGPFISLFTITHAPESRDGIVHVLYPQDVEFKLPESFLDKLRSHKHESDYISSDFKLTQTTTLDQVKSNYYIIEVDNYYYGLHVDKEWNLVAIALGPTSDPPYKVKDYMVLRPGDIENWQITDSVKRDPIVTTYGRYVTNYRVLCATFLHNKNGVLNKELAYINEYWNIGKIESTLSDLLVDDKVSVDECSSYIDNGYALGAFGEVCGSTFTRKAIIPSENILKRRDELLH